MLEAAQKLPAHSVVFMHNAHLFTDNSTVIQGIWNLRDSNKAEHRMLVMLAPQMKTPIELSNDVLVIDETLPDEQALQEIIETQCQHARTGATESGTKFRDMSAADVEKAVDALSGLSAFAAEQTVAVSFEKNGDGVGLNQRTLWDRKRQAIEETRGLKVWRDGETLDDVKGCENIKNFVRKIITGRTPPRAIVFVDEIEKSLAGSAGDTSGTSQDQLGVLLVEMQNKKAQGALFVGHPGSAKSMVAKATGNSAGIVTIQLDLGAMKGSLVGESEKNIRAAMKVIDAVSQGRALYIATCNKIGSLPPELKRRFTLGTFFFDLPTKAERESIWSHYLEKFDLRTKKGEPVWKVDVDDNGWTGADIFNCCNRAWMFNCSLAEAAKYATPICKTDPAGVETLRNLADGAFISANYEGLYQKTKQTVSLDGTTKRKMRFD
jgi:SpoVK/Ycf46/Vps4 family AAA+-type ATPase